MSNPAPITLTNVTLSGGMQLLNYNIGATPVTYNYILDENNNVITTEDNQNGFVTE